jgi:hypothetical protein
MKILVADFNATVGIENSFKKTGNEGLHQDSNDNCVRIVNVATSKNLVIKSTRFFRTETIISTTGPLLMGRLTTRLITY